MEMIPIFLTKLPNLTTPLLRRPDPEVDIPDFMKEEPTYQTETRVVETVDVSWIISSA
jgi:hypothetical protein